MISIFLPEQLAACFLAAIILIVPKLREVFFRSPNHPNASAQKLPERDRRLDAGKAVAMLAVIVVHGAYMFTAHEPETLPAAVRITNNLFRFAVPWFLMVTGIVLPERLSSPSDVLRFWSKRFAFVGIPYLFMTLLIAVFSRADPATTLSWIATGKALLPYYYILVLLQCYLLFPLMTRIRNERWFLPVAFFISFASFLAPHTWYVIGFPTVWQYLFFFCFGMHIRGSVLAHEPLTAMARQAWMLIALLGGVALIALPSQAYNASFFYGTALFSLFLALPARFFAGRAGLFLARLGKTTFATYLTHMFVVTAAYWLLHVSPSPDAVRFAATLTIAVIGSMMIGYLYGSTGKL